MMILLATLSALGASTGPVDSSVQAASADRPPVRLWMNNDRRFREGDRVRLQVDADVDGYLLVLNYDPSGRLRILFPLDPRDDARVEAGRRYEVRGQTNDAAFRAGGDGTGLIYTAVSEEPWRFDDIVLADRWDYTRLEIDSRTTDAEPEITDLVQHLAGPRGFDYDILGYRVYGESNYAYNTSVYPRGPTYIYDDYLYCNNWSWRYDGCHRYPFDGGWAFGVGLYYPYYYGYSPYRYGYGYGYGYPYYPSFPSRPSGRAPVIVGRPRGYTVQPRGSVGSGRIGDRVIGGSRGPSSRDGAAPPIDWRTRGPARPAREGGARGPDNVSAPGAAPPARRARGDGGYAPPSRDYGGRGVPSRGEAGPSSREAPRDRGEPARRGPDRSAPPPRREEPRSAPPPQAHSGGSSGGSSASGGHGRSRRP